MSDTPELPPLPDWLDRNASNMWLTREHLMAELYAYGRACQVPLLAKLSEKDAEIERMGLKLQHPAIAGMAIQEWRERSEKAERELADALALCNAANERAEAAERERDLHRTAAVDRDKFSDALERAKQFELELVRQIRALEESQRELRTQLEAIYAQPTIVRLSNGGSQGFWDYEATKKEGLELIERPARRN